MLIVIVRPNPVTEFKQCIELKIINTILTYKANVRHGKPLAIANSTFTSREFSSICTIIVVIGTTGCSPAESSLLITSHYTRFIVFILENPAFCVQIEFIGIVDVRAGVG